MCLALYRALAHQQGGNISLSHSRMNVESMKKMKKGIRKENNIRTYILINLQRIVLTIFQGTGLNNDLTANQSFNAKILSVLFTRLETKLSSTTEISVPRCVP